VTRWAHQHRHHRRSRCCCCWCWWWWWWWCRCRCRCHRHCPGICLRLERGTSQKSSRQGATSSHGPEKVSGERLVRHIVQAHQLPAQQEPSSAKSLFLQSDKIKNVDADLQRSGREHVLRCHPRVMGACLSARRTVAPAKPKIEITMEKGGGLVSVGLVAKTKVWRRPQAQVQVGVHTARAGASARTARARASVQERRVNVR
jgi:hypothetical protein